MEGGIDGCAAFRYPCSEMCQQRVYRRPLATPRIVHYATYVIGVLLVEGMIPPVTARCVGVEMPLLMHVLGVLAIGWPFVILQVTVAALAIKRPPLRQLFALTATWDVLSGLVSLLFVLVPEESHRWVNRLFVGGLLNPQLFRLGLPVLILWFLQRRRHASRGESQENGTSDAERETPAVTPVAQERGVNVRQAKRLWYRWDIVLLVVPLSFSVLLDPLGVINYASGLINIKVLAFAVFVFATLIPFGLLCLAALFVRMLVIWPKHISKWSRLALWWMAVISTFAACFVLPFTGLTPRPWVMYTRGFRRNMQARVDVPAIQQWLDTMDPNNLETLDLDEKPGGESEPDSVIAGLRPMMSQVALDDAGQPTLELGWGSGVLGTWGLMVGHRDMAIPQTRPRTKEVLSNGQVFYNEGQYRLPLAPGAYVWHDIE